MRELATVAALSSLEGTNAQLMFHMNAVMNCGISESQMDHLAKVIELELGEERGGNARNVLSEVMEQRKNINEKNREKN